MKKTVVLLSCLVLGVFLLVGSAQSKGELPNPKERCPVCGMFVAKYPQWVAAITLEDGKRYYFDGVKDMLAYYFAPQDFGGTAGQKNKEIEVTEYYRQQLIEAEKAWYVIGSDVLGPMGHELIPFASKAAAENFKKDHHGTEIILFQDITAERIDSMRQGHKMKMKK